MLPAQYRWLEAELGPRMIAKALKQYGTLEASGEADNPKIIGWQDELEAAGLGRVYAGVYRHGTLYRYYVSAPLQHGGRRKLDDPHPRRLAAAPLDAIRRLEIPAGTLIVTLAAHDHPFIADRLLSEERITQDPSDPACVRLTLPFRISTRRGKTEIISGNTSAQRHDPTLIRALRAAQALITRDRTGLPILEAAPETPHRQRLIRLAFLAPDLQQAILAGRQPKDLTLARLLDGRMPLLWSEQRKIFGDLQPAP